MKNLENLTNNLIEQLAQYPQDYAPGVAVCVAIAALLKEKDKRFAENRGVKKDDRYKKNLTAEEIDMIIAKSCGTNTRYAGEIRKFVTNMVKNNPDVNSASQALLRKFLYKVTLPKDEDSSDNTLPFDLNEFKVQCNIFFKNGFTLSEDEELYIQSLANCTQPIAVAIDPSKNYFCPVMQDKIKRMAEDLRPIFNMQNTEYWRVLFSLLHDLKHNHTNMALLLTLMQYLPMLPSSKVKERIKSLKEGRSSNSIEEIITNPVDYKYLLDYRDRFIQAMGHSEQESNCFELITVADCCTAFYYKEQIKGVAQNTIRPEDFDFIHMMYTFLNEDCFHVALEWIFDSLDKESTE